MNKILRVIGITVLCAVLIVFILITLNKNKIKTKALEKGFKPMEALVLKNFPDSPSRDSVHVLFSNVLRKIQSGEADRQEIKDLLLSFQLGLSDQKFDSLEINDILLKMKKDYFR